MVSSKMTLNEFQQILKSRNAVVRNKPKGYGFYITVNSVVVCSADSMVELSEKYLLT